MLVVSRNHKYNLPHCLIDSNKSIYSHKIQGKQTLYRFGNVEDSARAKIPWSFFSSPRFSDLLEYNSGYLPIFSPTGSFHSGTIPVGLPNVLPICLVFFLACPILPSPPRMYAFFPSPLHHKSPNLTTPPYPQEAQQDSSCLPVPLKPPAVFLLLCSLISTSCCQAVCIIPLFLYTSMPSVH